MINVIKTLFLLFTVFLLIFPATHPAISEKVYMERTENKTDNGDTEKLVNHIIIFPYSDPIFIQIMDLFLYCYLHRPFFGGMVRFGVVDFYDVTDDEPITVHVNYSVIWQDNHTILDRGSFTDRLWINHGFGFGPAALFEDVYKKNRNTGWILRHKN